MVISTQAAARAVVAIAILLSACGLAPIAPDETQRQGALQRWNHCLERYDANLEHYCDGHRRDVLVTYPPHHQFHINHLLRKRAQAISKARSLKTSLGTNPTEQ